MPASSARLSESIERLREAPTRGKCQHFTLPSKVTDKLIHSGVDIESKNQIVKGENENESMKLV